MAIDAASLSLWQRIVKKTITGRFDQTSDIERQLSLLELDILDRSYHAEGVDISVQGPQSVIEELDAFMQELNLY